MAWLNISKEFGYGWSEIWDWDFDWQERDLDLCFDPECTCDKDWGMMFNSYRDDRPMPCDSLPFRESMTDWTKRQEKWYPKRHDFYPKVKNKSVWSFARMVLLNNIGKSFSQAYSYYCKNVDIRYQKEFLDYFKEYSSRPELEDFWIENDEICITEGFYPSKKYYRRNVNVNVKKPVFFYSHDYSETWKIWGKTWYNSKEEYRTETFYRTVPDYYKDKAIFVSSTGFKKEFESKKDSGYKRLYHEEVNRQRKSNREHERLRKQKQYNFLTKFEIEAKLLLETQRLENEDNILRHGFDSKESFRGEHYHGRKNKQK